MTGQDDAKNFFLGRNLHMEEAYRLAGLPCNNTCHLQSALRSAGLTSNQIQNFTFDYSKMSKFDENLADQVVGEAASIPDKDAISEAAVKQLPHPQYDQETAERAMSPILPSQYGSSLPCHVPDKAVGSKVESCTKKARRKNDSERNPRLEEGSIRRALRGNLEAFNIQILCISFDVHHMLYRASISDGGEKTDRCFLTSKSVSRITKNKLVTIQVVDYKVKAKTLYISKYYIINKQPRIIGIPLRMCDIEEEPVATINLDIKLSQDHERLMDDFFRFTGEKNDSFEDNKAASLISGEGPHDSIICQLEALEKVRFDHCYTRCDYFENLDSCLADKPDFGSESVFKARSYDVKDGSNVTSSPTSMTSDSSDGCCNTIPSTTKLWPTAYFNNIEVGAECEL